MDVMDDEPVREFPRYLQLLWKLPTGPRRGPKSGMDIREIGAAAVAIADRDGLDAVSMKTVAQRLGVTTMSLYRYVDSRDELTEVMLDEAYGSPPAELSRSGSWRERLTDWAAAIAAGLAARPWMTSVTFAKPPVTPHVLAWTDAGLRSFRDVDLPVQQQFSALLLVDGFIRHHVQQCYQFGVLPAGRAQILPESGISYEQSIAALVSPEVFPDLAGAVRGQVDDDGDNFYTEELRYGLDVILDGLADRIDHHAGRSVRFSPDGG